MHFRRIRAWSEGDATDADGRLTSSVTGSVATTYTHDHYGRRTSAESAASATTYSRDAARPLAGLTTPDASATFAYGASGMWSALKKREWVLSPYAYMMQ